MAFLEYTKKYNKGHKTNFFAFGIALQDLRSECMDEEMNNLRKWFTQKVHIFKIAYIINKIDQFLPTSNDLLKKNK